MAGAQEDDDARKKKLSLDHVTRMQFDLMGCTVESIF